MDFWQVIKNRRSVRDFKDKSVPDKYINKIIAAASIAPSGSNQQNWHFIVIKDKKTKYDLKSAIEKRMQDIVSKMQSPRSKKEFLSYGYYFTFFVKAPVVVAVLMKPYDSLTGRILSRYVSDTSYISNAGIQSVAAAIENMLLAAASLGLGSCWMTGPLIARDSLEEVLKVKSPNQLLALVPVGFPKSRPKPHKTPVDVSKIITTI